jgi:acetyltransferase-like isoleucine patch superfamily enzyme
MLIYKKNSKIHNESRIFPFSKFTNSKIGAFSYVGIFSTVNNTEIGKFCSISSNFKSGLGTHPKTFISTSPFFYAKKFALKKSLVLKGSIFQEYKPIKIGNDVWIGADVLVHDGVNIGDGAIIASKSVVIKDVPEYSVVGGVPAKLIKYRFSIDVINSLKKLKWWDWEFDKLKEHKELFQHPIDEETLTKINKFNQ